MVYPDITSLFRKCASFYRLAIDLSFDELDIPSEKTYRTVVDHIDDFSTLKIAKCIAANQNQPYFNINDFLTPQFYEAHLYDVTYTWSDLAARAENWDEEKISQENIKALISFMARTALERVGISGADAFIHFEQIVNYLPQNLIDLGKQKMILYLMRMRKTNEVSASEEWKKLYRRSQLFSSDFLHKLAETFGPSFYIKTFADFWYNNGFSVVNKKIEKMLDQDSLNRYDIIFILRSATSIDRDAFLTIIKKADSKAKEEMRTYLYSDDNLKEDTFFMLSEDMTPMNINYQTINFPQEIRPHIFRSNPSWDKEIKNKWRDIFNDFKIIPATFLF